MFYLTYNHSLMTLRKLFTHALLLPSNTQQSAIPSSSIIWYWLKAVMLWCYKGNCGPGEKYWQPTSEFMTKSLASWLPRNQDQLQLQSLSNHYHWMWEYLYVFIQYSTAEWCENTFAFLIIKALYFHVFLTIKKGLIAKNLSVSNHFIILKWAILLFW